MMEEVEGYTNSQTWEAWLDSFQVFWDNTEIVFLLSVIISIVAVAYTLLYYPKTNNQDTETEEIHWKPEDSESSALDDNYTEDFSEDPSIASYDDAEPETRPSPKILTQKIEEKMSDNEKEEELQARNEQLKAIFDLMQRQKEKFGDTSIEDIKEQMKFYC